MKSSKLLNRSFGLVWMMLCLLGYTAKSYSQVLIADTINAERDVEQLIEDAVTSSQEDSETDWTTLTDYLNDLIRNPLDLNQATAEQLANLPGLSPMLVTAIQNYIYKFGFLTSIYELQAVPGMTADVFAKIKPFIKVEEGKSLDIRGKHQHPKGPDFKLILEGGKFSTIQRFSRILEPQEGFLPPDTTSRGQPKTRYLGSPWKSFSRIRYQYRQNVSIALIGENDAGEPFRWNPSKRSYGYDYLSAHFYLRDFGNLKRLVVGDYVVSVGQGLILSRGLGFGKGSETINAVKRVDLGIQPYTSINEVNFLRGAAATYALKQFSLSVYASRQYLDAAVKTLYDTLVFDNEVFTSFQTFGYHRTESEINQKASVSEDLLGGRVAFSERNLNIGITGLYQRYSTPWYRGEDSYQRYNFNGKTNNLVGFDWDWGFRNMNFFGEIARSASGAVAGIAGVTAAVSSRAELAIQIRNLPKDYHSMHGFIFGERPLDLQNERAIYTGLKLKINSKWSYSSFLDVIYFPWYLYKTSAPSYGVETLHQISYKINRNSSVYIRFRRDFKQQDVSSSETNQMLVYQVPVVKKTLRLDFNYLVAKNLQLHSRLETVWYSKENLYTQQGLLFYQDVVWKFIPWLEATVRWAHFRVPDYNARIYAYEQDVLTAFSIPAYYGLGQRWYFMLAGNIKRNVDFWVRIAQTRLYHENTIGSGLDLIQGNKRTELKLQVRYSF
ncbi:MAG: helix-hairpin-helix domain-containing protein [Bacteroidia bacterium]|nr:helix-hairpin-helix domain-containing protein [Bacteroidia bacterium]